MRELESEEKKEEKEVFVEKKRRRELWRMWIGEGDKENEEEKKMLVTVGKNEKARTHLMAKLHVV